MKINYCVRCHHEWPSKLERAFTCSKCRSPYWDVPRQTDAIDDGSEGPADIPGEMYSEMYGEMSLSEKKIALEPPQKEELSKLQGLINSIKDKPTERPVYAPPQLNVWEEPTIQ